jgi:hypothetical protein
LERIILDSPIRNFNWRNSTSQLFGVNHNFYSRYFNLPGHQGIDVVIRDNRNGFGHPILAMHDGTVEKIVYDVPHHTKGNGLYVLSPNKHFSTVYWHLSGFHVDRIGQKVERGQPIGMLGNSGWVRPKPDPNDPKAMYNGCHLHAALKIHDKGFWQGRENYYRGFVDPTPFFKEAQLGMKLPIEFRRSLFLTSEGDDVAWLGTCLILELGHERVPFEPFYHFGRRTRKAVKEVQRKYSLSPVFGFVGSKTRQLLNGRWSFK